MAKRKAESQIGSLILYHKKSKIDLTPCMQVACDTPLESSLDESYNFALDLILIKGLSTKL
jgi:hypothetical protein